MKKITGAGLLLGFCIGIVPTGNVLVLWPLLVLIGLGGFIAVDTVIRGNLQTGLRTLLGSLTCAGGLYLGQLVYQL